jgi:hypothetical protein
MAVLLSAVEAAFDTDFAIASAAQDGVVPSEVVMTYAASMPGLVSLVCGWKYAPVRVRAERWDGRPPPAGPEWEDADELPFAAVPDGGPLRLAGFDPPEPDAPGLDVTGLSPARVEVLAAGRHRYDYGDLLPDDPAIEPERWLLRLWPADGPPDPLAGPPRRIAGALPHDYRRSAWYAALHAWDQAGWGPVMRGELGKVHQALLVAGRPRPADGLDGDAVATLERHGLLVRAGGLLYPNPVPPLAWETVDDPPERALRTSALRADHAPYEADLLYLVWWAGGSVTVTPRRLAVRLALRADGVVGALRLLALSGKARVAPEEFDADVTVTVTSERP